MAEGLRYKRVISADSHVMEPLDLWWKAIGHKFGDRTPRQLDEYEGRKGTFFYSGYAGWPVGQVFEPGNETEPEVRDAYDKGFSACGYDPEVRIKFQDEAGIEAETMNSTRLLGVMRNPDVEVLQASAEVFNDWDAEFCSYNRKRLLGISVIPMHNIDWATKELERTVKKGLVGPMINCQAPEGSPPYRSKEYDKFWAIAEEANAPLTLHLLTGRIFDPLVYAHAQTAEEGQENPGQWVDLFNEIQRVLANDFIFGGILERFPKLKIVCSEYEMSWLPGFMARLDQIQVVGPRMRVPNLEMKASDYMRTRVYHGFIDDTAADYSIPLVGASQVLWGSDFPHIRAMGLDTQGDIYNLIQKLPFEDQEKVVGVNSAKVFNVDR